MCIRDSAYITIQQLSEALEQQHQKVGLTTIYRTLDKLEQEKAIDVYKRQPRTLTASRPRP